MTVLAFLPIAFQHNGVVVQIYLYDFNYNKSFQIYPSVPFAELNITSHNTFCHFPQNKIIHNKSLCVGTTNLNLTFELLHYTRKYINRSVDHLIYKKAFVSNYSFYHLQDVFYCQLNTFCSDVHTSYYIDTFGVDALNISKVTRTYDHLLAISQLFYFYGDVQLGTIHRLLAVPKDIIEKSVILLQSEAQMKQVEDFLSVMNVTTSLEAIDPFEYVFARNLYTILPIWYDGDGEKFRNGIHHAFAYPFMWNYSEFVRKHFNVTSIVPYKYVIMNRAKGGNRYVSNVHKIQKRLMLDHPNINFEIVSSQYESLEATVKVVVHFKWVWCTVGSNVMNLVYMCPKTAVCLFMMDVFDPQSFDILISRGIWVVCYYDPRYMHFNPKPLRPDVNYISYQVNRSFYMLENQRLPPVPEMTPEEILKDAKESIGYIIKRFFMRSLHIYF